MLTQNINALKLAMALYEFHAADPASPRMSLLDVIVLLTILEHPRNGKNDLLQIINDRNTSKSFLDNPVARLMRYKLLDRHDIAGVVTKQNEARVVYSVSEIGLVFLKGCAA